MATTKFQRWGIIAIVVVTVVGTIGGFAAMVLAQQSSSKQAAKYQQLLSKYQTEEAAYEKKVAAQTEELSTKYYETFKQYSSKVASYDISSVSSLTTEDLAAGDGETISSTTKFATYYIGWDANGHVFDQSIDTSTNKLKAPLSISTGLTNARVITGWKEGLVGMKVGGVRLLNIPSDKAYGESGSKDSSGNEIVAANMPLKFVVMAIPLPETIAEPDSTELMNLYVQMKQ